MATSKQDVLGAGDGELGVEATLAIAELVRVDAVTESKAPPYSWTFGGDDSRAVNARHQGESWPPRPAPRTVE